MRNGRLVATIATCEFEKGILAVAVSRCNPVDQPRKDIGRQICEARLNRYLQFLNGEEASIKQAGRNLRDSAAQFVFVMERDEFIEKIIDANPFVSGSCPYGKVNTIAISND